MIGSVAFSIGFIIYTFLLPASGFTTEADLANLLSAKKNAATLTGCLVGLALVYPLDRFVIKFDTKGRWYSQVIKFVVGVAVVLAIKSGLKSPLEALFGNEYVARAARYFLIVAFAGGLWPLTFKFFERLRIEKLERFTEWVLSKFRKEEAVAK